MSRRKHLDGLRGLAIALVLVHHFAVPLLGSALRSPGAYAAAALTLAYTGVDLFFVLSGYLIGGILLDNLDSPALLPAFYARRAARILPLNVLCVAAILGARSAGLYPPGSGGRPYPAFGYLLFSTNLWIAHRHDWGFRPLSPLWSLSIEEQFYLVAPFVLRWVPRSRHLALLLAVVLLAPICRWAILARGGSALAAGMLPFCRMDCIGLGFLAAWLLRRPSFPVWSRRRRAVLPGVLFLALLGCGLLTKLRAGNGGLAMAAGGYTVVAIFYAGFLLVCESDRDSALCRCLAWPPLALLGRGSYFMYLFQELVIGLAVEAVFHRRLAVGVPENWVELAAGLGVLALAAAVSWRWLERPLIALGHRRPYRDRPLPVAALGAAASPD